MLRVQSDSIIWDTRYCTRIILVQVLVLQVRYSDEVVVSWNDVREPVKCVCTSPTHFPSFARVAALLPSPLEAEAVETVTPTLRVAAPIAASRHLAACVGA